MTEERRRGVTIGLAATGWMGATAITALRVTEVIPIQWGSAALLFIGMAIASSLALSRMRLAKTITQVFAAGIAAQNVHWAEVNDERMRDR